MLLVGKKPHKTYEKWTNQTQNPKVNLSKVYEGTWHCWFLMFYKDKEKDNNICLGTASILLTIRKKEKWFCWQNRVVGTVKDKCLFVRMQEE